MWNLVFFFHYQFWDWSPSRLSPLYLFICLTNWSKLEKVYFQIMLKFKKKLNFFFFNDPIIQLHGKHCAGIWYKKAQNIENSYWGGTEFVIPNYVFGILIILSTLFLRNKRLSKNLWSSPLMPKKIEVEDLPQKRTFHPR